MKKYLILTFILSCLQFGISSAADYAANNKTRVIITSDGEIDDECSVVRFLLYANEWDIEGIITSSSQYHWQGHKWAGDDWIEPYLEAYEEVYPNLLEHDNNYPTPEYLKSITLLGNVKAEGEMEERTAGSELIVKALLDETDKRPIWLQAWGGTNTIARALKTIEEEHPEKMEMVADKIRLFLIWEQDNTYQEYIRKHWGKYNILTIISDQFITYFYHWKKFLPFEPQKYLTGEWMNKHIIKNHGALCSLYKAHENGDFRSEGDSPAYFHVIPTGLRNEEHPDWGGWGGRYIKIRENTWLDPVEEEGYEYPEGRWFTDNAWGRVQMRKNIKQDPLLIDYMKPTWRWIDVLQNDFAARADWCVKPYEDANHAPLVRLKNELDITAKPGDRIVLSAEGSDDPDGDVLHYRWWIYKEAGTYGGDAVIQNPDETEAVLTVPDDMKSGETIHVICEVKDSGEPELTRYQRTVVSVK